MLNFEMQPLFIEAGRLEKITKVVFGLCLLRTRLAFETPWDPHK